MATEVSISEAEVRQHLAALGYTNLPDYVLHDFMEGACLERSFLMATDLLVLANQETAPAPMSAKDEVPNFQADFSSCRRFWDASKLERRRAVRDLRSEVII